MNRADNYLETLTPSINFFDGNQSRLDSLANRVQIVNDNYNKVRPRMDSNLTIDELGKRIRGISDAVLVDERLIKDMITQQFTSRRNSVFMIPDLGPTVDEIANNNFEGISKVENTSKSKHEVKEEKKIPNRKKSKDSFDFNIPVTKNTAAKTNQEKQNIADRNIKSKFKSKIKGKQNLFGSEKSNDKLFDNNKNGPCNKPQRLRMKIKKTKAYWANKSHQIPNIFRLTSLVDNGNEKLMEFQDYSKKIAATQIQTQDKNKNSPILTIERNRTDSIDREIAAIHRRSINLALDYHADIKSLFN